jgi:hypothetical protein
MKTKNKVDKCNTCSCEIGTEGCGYPSLKNRWFLGNEKENSICCEQCQQEILEDLK